MIFVSLILVIVAAVTLVLGIFADGLGLVYVSIGACLGAMAVLGVGGLLRRRSSSAPPPAGYADDRTASSAASRPPVVPAPDDEAAAAEHDGPAARPPVARPAAKKAAVRKIAAEQTGTAETAETTETAVERPAAKKATVRTTAVGQAAATEVTSAEVTSPPGGSLTDVKGLGPAKRNALLSRFGDEAAIATASLDELISVPGIGERLARSIQATLS